MSEKRSIRVSDFLGDADLKKCVALYVTSKPETAAKEICEQIIKPQIAAINKKLNQENDPMFLAYMVEYVIKCSGGDKLR